MILVKKKKQKKNTIRNLFTTGNTLNLAKAIQILNKIYCNYMRDVLESI